MSPRAAWRLERLGFAAVSDYAAGKVDWMAAGLPTVRRSTEEVRALDVADRYPRTCGPSESIVGDAVGSVLVVTKGGVLLGRVNQGMFAPRPSARAEDVMEPGPTTVRAHEPAIPLLERMRRRNVDEIAITTPEGVLLGVVRRAEAERTRKL